MGACRKREKDSAKLRSNPKAAEGRAVEENREKEIKVGVV